MRNRNRIDIGSWRRLFLHICAGLLLSALLASLTVFIEWAIVPERLEWGLLATIILVAGLVGLAYLPGAVVLVIGAAARNRPNLLTVKAFGWLGALTFVVSFAFARLEFLPWMISSIITGLLSAAIVSLFTSR